MRGAYGFELLGAAGASAQLVEGEPDWPLLEIERHTGAASLGRSFITADRAAIALLAGDWLAVERVPLRAIYTTAQPLSDDALVHPYLAPAAAIAAYWLGRDAFHAGAFLLDGGVWGVIGDKESGKSSFSRYLRAGVTASSQTMRSWSSATSCSQGREASTCVRSRRASSMRANRSGPSATANAGACHGLSRPRVASGDGWSWPGAIRWR